MGDADGRGRVGTGYTPANVGQWIDEWRADVVHALGREYGWSADDTLDADFGIVVGLQWRIAEQRAAEARAAGAAGGSNVAANAPDDYITPASVHNLRAAGAKAHARAQRRG